MEQLLVDIGRQAAALGLALNEGQLSQLVTHLRLLQKWNAKLNLVGPGDLATWARRHTVDSLAAARWAAPGAALVDVGSGAGFPGIPLAVVNPEVEMTLVEPRANRSAFLRNVAANARVPLRIETCRASQLTARFDLVLGRAVAEPTAWAEMAQALCKDGGKFVLFQQAGEPPAEIAGATRVDWSDYQVEGEPTRSVGLYVPRGTA